ncbi:uncharacterized protein BP01DRAFT_385755 [Aspergillus saccharolyticus JOP 1030-1]|uniref:Uncharacterized protein n=1 Tax=Aspergillus saccharolyticus JOP 1030-1 TaxID=1450539 RepID=A0A318Z4V5_9EURO|nr:hypothetical protein BP01DRAFT_385755 [Aspergillus saccharolyticus JOP 1030-1]PYH42089.1 hypothetical protein BP01DRAFT_385755 [Aspergillus saccharolyticus JOP 1030-1]
MPIPIPPSDIQTTESSLDPQATENNTTSTTTSTNPSVSSTSYPSQPSDVTPLSKEEADRVAETITIPEIQLPTSIESVLRTALPTSQLSRLADPSARASFLREIREGLRPEWYSTLPTDVKHFFSTANVGADLCHATARGGAPAPAPAGLGAGIVGVAAFVGVMNAL